MYDTTTQTRWTVMQTRVSAYGRRHERVNYDLCAEAPNGSFPLVGRYQRRDDAEAAGVAQFGQAGRVAVKVAFPS